MESFSAWISSLGEPFETEGQASWYFPDKNLRVHYEEPGEGIRIWHGQWKFQGAIVKSRIRSRLGLLPSLPARVCVIKRITQPLADAFLQKHHLQGKASSKTKLGLFLPSFYYRLLPFVPESADFLLGVMTFSGGRTFRDGSRSFELVRFAMHSDFHVKGAFSKLFRSFEREKAPDSVMTYVDKEWYQKGVYGALGFEEQEHLPARAFDVEEDGTWRGGEGRYMNKGSIKMVWQKK